jgi:hypothetical protein
VIVVVIILITLFFVKRYKYKKSKEQLESGQTQMVMVKRESIDKGFQSSLSSMQTQIPSKELAGESKTQLPLLDEQKPNTIQNGSNQPAVPQPGSSRKPGKEPDIFSKNDDYGGDL